MFQIHSVALSFGGKVEMTAYSLTVTTDVSEEGEASTGQRLTPLFPIGRGNLNIRENKPAYGIHDFF